MNINDKVNDPLLPTPQKFKDIGEEYLDYLNNHGKTSQQYSMSQFVMDRMYAEDFQQAMLHSRGVTTYRRTG